jgi:hypothetical protein
MSKAMRVTFEIPQFVGSEDGQAFVYADAGDAGPALLIVEDCDESEFLFHPEEARMTAEAMLKAVDAWYEMTGNTPPGGAQVVVVE